MKWVETRIDTFARPAKLPLTFPRARNAALASSRPSATRRSGRAAARAQL